MTYKIKFIDSYRFMQSKLSDLVDNSLGINNMECKSCITIHGNLSLLDLKITDYIKNAKNAKKKK